MAEGETTWPGGSVEHFDASGFVAVDAPFGQCPDMPNGFPVGTQLSYADMSDPAAYAFDGFTLDGKPVDPNEAVHSITFDGKTPSFTIAGKYRAICHKLTINDSKGVSVDPEPNCPTGLYRGGTQVQFGVRPRDGEVLRYWEGGDPSSEIDSSLLVEGFMFGKNASVIMNRDRTVQPLFRDMDWTEKIEDKFDEFTDGVAVVTKKFIGVAAVWLEIMVKPGFIGAIEGFVEVFKVVDAVLPTLGVEGGIGDDMREGLGYVQETIDFLFDFTGCTQEWAFGGNHTPDADASKAVARGLRYSQAVDDYQKDMAKAKTKLDRLKVEKKVKMRGLSFSKTIRNGVYIHSTGDGADTFQWDDNGAAALADLSGIVDCMKNRVPSYMK